MDKKINTLAGDYSDIGAAVCTNCLAGKYSVATASYCTDCDAGSYSTAASSSSCMSCGNLVEMLNNFKLLFPLLSFVEQVYNINFYCDGRLARIGVPYFASLVYSAFYPLLRSFSFCSNTLLYCTLSCALVSSRKSSSHYNTYTPSPRQ